jgi:DNA-binding transcriptional ArsR family regulator
MKAKNKHSYSEKTLEICRHARIISNVDRIYLIEVLVEHERCRVNQLAMETGLSVRQVYYQLSVLRKMEYIVTKFNKGRYFVYPGPGMIRGKEVLGSLLNSVEEAAQNRPSHLRIV